MKAVISMVVTFIGSAFLGVMLVLSEILYSEIEKFSQCPLWYRLSMYLSLIIIIVGLFLCSKFKNKDNVTKFEKNAEIVLFILGILWLSVAFDGNETYQKNVMICVGGALLSVGIFCGFGSMIGYFKVSKNAKQTNSENVYDPYADIIEENEESENDSINDNSEENNFNDDIENNDSFDKNDDK